MKKFVVLVLVLGMAAMANAGLEWAITGGSGAAGEIMPGDAITLTLSGDAATGVRIGALTDNGADGVITGVTLNALFATGSGAGMPVPDFDAILIGAGAGASGLAADDLAWIDMVSTTAATGAADAIMSILYTAGSAGDVVIGALADPTGLLGLPANIELLSGPVGMPEAAFTVVPEPMTFALLGLGGLFLRRRK